MKREELLKTAKPILFNSEMVKAILEDRKTVTRRVIKTELSEFLGFGYDWVSKDKAVFGFSKYGHLEAFKPRYQVGDILYVRETWGDYTYDEPNGSAAYYVYYRADYEDGVKTYIHPQKDDCGEEIVCDLPKWKPSIHMPKDAARIFLKVTNVRVERLKEITYEGCISEGITDDYKTYSEEYHDNLARRAYPVIFSDLWNSTINKQDLDEYGWEANPYVWVIEFERVEVEV